MANAYDNLSAVPDSTNRTTILVVDDEPAILFIVEKVLRKGDYLVLTASDAKEALALCQCHGPNISLALLDFLMPGTNGSVLARWLKDLYPNIRIAMMSAYPPPDFGVSEIPFTLDAFIPKPFDVTALLAGVRLALDSAPSKSPG